MPGTTGPAEAGASDEAAEFDEAGSEEDGGEGLEDEASPGAALSAGPENESLPTDSASEPAPEANGTKAEPERGSFSLFSWIRGGGSKEG